MGSIIQQILDEDRKGQSTAPSDSVVQNILDNENLPEQNNSSPTMDLLKHVGGEISTIGSNLFNIIKEGETYPLMESAKTPTFNKIADAWNQEDENGNTLAGRVVNSFKNFGVGVSDRTKIIYNAILGDPVSQAAVTKGYSKLINYATSRDPMKDILGDRQARDKADNEEKSLYPNAGKLDRSTAFIGNAIWGLSGEPTAQLFGAGTGLNPETGEPMSVEDHANMIKVTAANIATYFVATKIHAATEQRLINEPFAAGAKNLNELAEGGEYGGKISDSKLANTIYQPDITRLGKLGIRATGLAVTGAAAGYAYGLVSNLGDEDVFSKAASDAVNFIPASILLGGLFGGLSSRDKIDPEVSKDIAERLYQIRQIKYIKDQSLADNISKVEAVRGADDLAEAIINSKKNSNQSTFVIPGVKRENLGRLQELAGDSFELIPSSQTGDSFDVLFTAKNALTDSQKYLFRRSGFIKDEIISLDGQDVILRDANPLTGKAKIQDIKNGNISEVDIGNIRRNVNGNLDNVEGLTLGESLKGQFLRESQTDKVVTPTELAAHRAVRNAETGRPFIGIGFRQTRGTPLLKTGKFWTPDANFAGTFALYADIPGRTTTIAGPNHSLEVGRIVLNNPFVVDGSHIDLVKSIIDGTSGLNVSPKDGKILEGIYKSMANSPGESGYGLLDREIARVMKENGHDGIIYRKGLKLRDRQEIIDLSDNAFKPSGKNLSKRGGQFQVGTASLDNIVDHLYNDFKSAIGGIDSQPTDGKTFQNIIQDWVNQKGLLNTDIPFITKEFGDRLSAEAREIYSNEHPEEYQYIKKIFDELEEYNKNVREDTEHKITNSSQKLVEAAASNGMVAELSTGGNVAIRDRETGKILGRFNKISDAHEFVNKSGQATSDINYDGQGGVPHNNVPPLPPKDGNPSVGNPEPLDYNASENARADYEIKSMGWWERIANTFHSRMGIFTPVGEQLKAIDNIFGTQLHAKIYQPTQNAFRKTAAVIDIHRRMLRPLLKAVRRMSMEERALISDYRETMSAETMVKKGGLFRNRAMTDLEIAHGKWLAEHDIELKKVYGYRRARFELAKEVPSVTWVNGIPEFDNSPSIQERLANLKEIYGIDDIHDQAVRIFDSTQNYIETTSQYAIGRYAQALMEKTLDRDDFAKLHNMSKVHTFVAEQLDKMYENFAEEFGIEDSQYLNGYMNHYRDFNGYLPDDYLGPDKDFISKLHRTGEITDFEKDPIRALERYIIRGFKSKEDFYNILNRAGESLRTEVEKVRAAKGNKAAQDVMNRVSRYLNEVNGSRSIEKVSTEKTIEQAFHDYNGKLGIKLSGKAAEDLVGAWLSISEAGAQGLRPMAGLRDYITVVHNYFTRFGSVRTTRMLLATSNQKIIDALVEKGVIPGGTKNVQRALESQGTIPTLNTRQLIDPANTSLGMGVKTKTTIQNIGEVGLKGSLQDRAYRRAHAGAYMETWHNAAENLRLLSENKITKEKAYKNMSLKQYDVSIQRNVDELVKQGKNDQAAEYLANVNGAETVFLYGAANHPLYWNTNIGRLLGQFGMWSTYEARFMTRMLTRGTLADRAARLMRYSAGYAAMYATSRALGLNLSSWYNTPSSLLERGGALPSILYNSIDAVFSTSKFQRDQARSKVERYFPYIPGVTPASHVGQVYLPFSYAIQDWVKAADLWNRGFNPALVPLQGMGIQADRLQESWADQLFGIHPKLGYGGGRPSSTASVSY